MTSQLTFSELIDISEREMWCTRPLCTTCGAHPFRTALRAIPLDDVIAGLRLLSEEFLSSHRGLFRLVISEVSFFGVGGELLDPLAGTPAGDHLRANIDWQHCKYERQKAYLATQTPEAIAERRAERKAAKLQLSAPHRERKSASELGIRAAAQELDATPATGILGLVTRKNFGVPLRAVGGLVYQRLLEHYKAAPIRGDDLRTLSELAERHSGHWRKLLVRVLQPTGSQISGLP
jgi:hypothetical protein